jgi:hypothetical protein
MVCFECDEPADHQHHVVPRSLGGTRTVPLCARCHATVHDTGITTSDLTAAAMQRKRERGEHTGGLTPYGWRVARCGVMLEEDEYEQRVIGEILRLRELGYSLRKVAQRLADLGFVSRTGRTVSKSSVARAERSRFSPNTINRIAKSQRIVDAQPKKNP